LVVAFKNTSPNRLQVNQMQSRSYTVIISKNLVKFVSQTHLLTTPKWFVRSEGEG
jgi:hypothetical protein